MQHGLMVSFWMAINVMQSFWIWKSKAYRSIKGVSIVIIFLLLLGTTLLTRSANAYVFSIIGIICWYIFNKAKNPKVFILVFLSIPLYMSTRVLNILSIDAISTNLSKIFDENRMQSLVFRLNQEDLFSVKAIQRLFFGWGGWGRGKPVDPITGEQLAIVDSLWIILFSSNGIVGLISLFSAMLIGPWMLIKNKIFYNNKRPIEYIILSLVVVFFMIDSLLNSMVNPVYILCAGALVSYYENSLEISTQMELGYSNEY